MYKLGYRIHQRHHWRRAFIASIFVILIAIGLSAWYIHTHSGSVILNASHPLTTNVQPAAPATKTFSEPIFSIDLPTSWQLINYQTSPSTVYTWQNTTKFQDGRVLNLYVDTTPTTYAIDKLLPVTLNGDHLTVGALSDNCINFSGSSSTSTKHPQSLPNVTAKWAGINFICDLSNYSVNAIGTGSTAGVNKVVLTGKTTGQHAFFFVYIDHTSEPDYSAFLNALTSFSVK